MLSTSRWPESTKLEPDPEAVERRVAGAHPPQPGDHAPLAAQVVRSVLVRLQRDVVAEPLRLLVRVCVAADVDEQRRVVDGRPRLVVEAEPLGDAQRDQALAQHVLHRLAEAEVDPERERRDELGQPNGRPFGVAGRARDVGRSLRDRSLGSDDSTRTRGPGSDTPLTPSDAKSGQGGSESPQRDCSRKAS